MTEDTKKAIDKIASYLKSLGFKKKTLTWFKEKKEFILLIDLQKSSWSSEYYVNVGILFNKSLEDTVKTHKSDLRYRVFGTDKQNKYNEIYKIEDEAEEIIKLIQRQVIDEFDNLETIRDIQTKVLSGNKEKYLLTVKAREILKV